MNQSNLCKLVNSRHISSNVFWGSFDFKDVELNQGSRVGKFQD